MAISDVVGQPDAIDGSAGRRVAHVPGESGVWVLLLGDMVVFAARPVWFELHEVLSRQPDSPAPRRRKRVTRDGAYFAVTALRAIARR